MKSTHIYLLTAFTLFLSLGLPAVTDAGRAEISLDNNDKNGDGRISAKEWKKKEKIFKGIDPNVVHAQHGWWFPDEEDTPDHGNWRSNANALTSMQPPYCNAMGTYQLRALLCKVLPVEESEEPWRPDLPEKFYTNVKEVQGWS